MKMWWATPTSALDCEGTEIGSYFLRMIIWKKGRVGGEVFFWKSEIDFLDGFDW